MTVLEPLFALKPFWSFSGVKDGDKVSKGNIIKMYSMACVHRHVNATAYATTKAALTGMTRNLTIEKHQRVSGSIVYRQLGLTMKYSSFDSTPNPAKFREFYDKHSQYMGRLVEPVEVAKTCLYLASDSTYSTGQNT